MTLSAFHVNRAGLAGDTPVRSTPRRQTDTVPRAEAPGILRVLTCGSVDDGKSTLIGRLLWEAGNLPDDTREFILNSAGRDSPPDVSLLLDGLEDERAQGITIDIAWRYFDLAARRYVFIDCPGHEQYTRNMATGASQADTAILLVDARHGIKRQTRRHTAILKLVGVDNLIVAVNKMDLVDWSEPRFHAIVSEFETLAESLGLLSAAVIPVSARLGDNVTRPSARMSWFGGPTLLSALDAIERKKVRDDIAFRFPVQMVVRDDNDFRGLAGTVTSGRIARGDQVLEVQSGRTAHVSRISTFEGDQETATTGSAVAIELDEQLDISRGGMLTHPANPAILMREIEARLVWLSDAQPARTGFLLRTATDLVPVSNLTIIARLDLNNLIWRDDSHCTANDIAEARISLSRGTPLDRFSKLAATGAFILVDALSGSTVAGGIVTGGTDAAVRRTGNRFQLTRALLASTVCADLANTESERQEFHRRAQEVAFLMSAAGVSVDLEQFDGASMEDGGTGI